MKIKKLLYLLPVISLLVIISSVSVILITMSVVTTEIKLHDDTEVISGAMLELHKITYDYLVYHENRMIAQWDLKYDSLQESIKKNGELFALLNPKFDSLDEKFFRVVENYEKEQESVRENADPEIIKALQIYQVGIEEQLLHELQSIQDNSKDMTKQTNYNAQQSQNLANLVVISSISGLVLAIVVFSAFVATRITTSLSELEKATEIIAAGNLEKNVVCTERKDEIGNLARSFDYMRKSIKKSNKAQKKLEENLNKQVTKRTVELENANILLRAIDRKKDEFASMITHELKSPLTPIIGWCEVLMRPKIMGELTKKQTKAIYTIHANASRLEKLVSDVLDAQKLDMKKMAFDNREFNVNEMFNELESDFRYITIGIDFVTKSPTNLVLKSDKNRIQQVITNIINNALDFIPKENGKITLNATEVDHSVLFSVKDNGAGIPDDEKKNLFQKFYQIDTSSTRKHRGTGLGLTICKGIVEGLRGKIWIESENGKGSSFYITIPKKVIKEE